MKQAKNGTRVWVRYIGTLANGRIFDTTEDGEPLAFTIGANEVFPALEEQVTGMSEGQTRNFTLAAADAYGPWLEKNLMRVDRTIFPAEKEIRIGQKLSIDFVGGACRMMRVRGLDEHSVLLDGNHALAGQDLTFALTLVGVESER